MTRTPIVALAALALVICVGRSARAADAAVPDRGQLTADLGAGVGTGEIHHAGAAMEGPVLYAAFELQVRIHGPLGVGVRVGGIDVSGWLLGANLRAEAHPARYLFLSAGVGPAVVASGTLANLVFLEGDATLSLRATDHLAMTFGPVVGFAMNHAGTPHCGVDTCQAWAVPGDRLILLRLGFGGAF